MENSIATRKKRRDVICSGIIPVAQRTMVTSDRAATLDSDGERRSGVNNRRARAPIIASVVKTSFSGMLEGEDVHKRFFNC